jgi:predicted RNA binding protein YcfA (HicA-like mRNA interferase family)
LRHSIEIFTSSPEINTTAENELRRLGFNMIRSKAGHNELAYKDKYYITVTCSPSGGNVANNRVSDIKKKLNIYKD